ncbi:MAG TPA: carbonic anhydrase [Candidatus Binatia bacterium]|nr:carbonic anhydrase [Candidatus Binatia bacterium]
MSQSQPGHTPPETPTARELPAASGDQALQKLLEGNRRYVAGTPLRPRQTARRRAAVAQSQRPIAVVFGCADSRVPPEILFDQGLGDLFVIRLAGHIVTDAVLGSIEYAVAELGVPLVMVLGHERCGAVKAAVEAARGGGTNPGHIDILVNAIKPAVGQVKGAPGDVVENAVRAHVTRVVEELRSSAPLLAPLVQAGKLKIVGARNDLDSGGVEIIG